MDKKPYSSFLIHFYTNECTDMSLSARVLLMFIVLFPGKSDPGQTQIRDMAR